MPDPISLVKPGKQTTPPELAAAMRRALEEMIDSGVQNCLIVCEGFGGTIGYTTVPLSGVIFRGLTMAIMDEMNSYFADDGDDE